MSVNNRNWKSSEKPSELRENYTLEDDNHDDDEDKDNDDDKDDGDD